MLQIVMVHAIMAGMVTPEEADVVASRLYHQKLPDKPSEVWNEIQRTIEQVKRESALSKSGERGPITGGSYQISKADGSWSEPIPHNELP